MRTKMRDDLRDVSVTGIQRCAAGCPKLDRKAVSGPMPHAGNRILIALPVPEHQTENWSEKPFVEQSGLGFN